MPLFAAMTCTVGSDAAADANEELIFLPRFWFAGPELNEKEKKRKKVAIDTTQSHCHGCTNYTALKWLCVGIARDDVGGGGICAVYLGIGSPMSLRHISLKKMYINRFGSIFTFFCIFLFGHR